MRIVIVKTDAAGGGVDHFTTDPDHQGAVMKEFTSRDYGLSVEFPSGEYRIYPWSSIKFVDKFHTP